MALWLVASCALLPLVASQAPLQAPQRQLRGVNESSNMTPQVRANAGANLSAAVGMNMSILSSHSSGTVHIAYSLDPSFCLATDWNRIGNGVEVHLWKCDATWRSTGQNFFMDIDGKIRVLQDPSYCIVIDGDRHENGAKIQLWWCDEQNPNQVWSGLDLPGRISARAAQRPMCLVIDGNRPRNGAKIQLWECNTDNYEDRAQGWMSVHHFAGWPVAYAVPSINFACPWPFAPVEQSAGACAAAAELLRPGEGCSWGDSPLSHWSELVTEVDKPLWPKGCYFRGACQGGCGLSYNPTGHTDSSRSYPGAGDCQSISVICQLRVA